MRDVCFEHNNYIPAAYISDEDLLTLRKNNIDKRLRTLKYCNNIIGDRELVIKKCKTDIHFWMNNFCCTYDPRRDASPNHLPFVAYPFQLDVVNELASSIQDQQDILIEKSRDMGASWLTIYVFQWLWQFHQGNNFLLGSQNDEKLDKLGDLSSLFEKLRFSIKEQPQWLLPQGFNKNKHLTSKKIVNPENGNAITGESSTPDFSRSGRYTAVMFDEFAFWQHGHEAWGAAADSTNCRIPVSTPWGMGNRFASLRHSTSIKLLTLHWTMHPRKTKNIARDSENNWTSDWYEKQKTRRTKTEVARELDIDYLTSREDRVYMSFSRRIHRVEGLYKNWKGVKELIRVWDFGLNPAVIFCVAVPQGLRVLKEFVPDDRPTLLKLINRVFFETNRSFPGWHISDICDKSGVSTNSQTGDTDIEVMKSNGINPHYELVPIENGITAVEYLLERPEGFLIDADCPITIEAFEGGYYRKEDKSGLGKEMRPEQVHPYEDVMDCIRYAVWKHFKPLSFQQKKNEKEIYKQARLRGEEF